MELSRILEHAIETLRTKDDYTDFDSQISLERVIDFIKDDPTNLIHLSGREYKRMFFILTSMVVSRFSTSRETNVTLTGVAFYSAYRCLDCEFETGEKLYDDGYSNTNNLLFIFGHDYLTDILQNANASNGSPYDPIANLEVYGSEENIYQMEYAQYLNNPRVTGSEELYVERYNKIRQTILYNINDRIYLNQQLRKNQEKIYKYVKSIIEQGEYIF